MERRSALAAAHRRRSLAQMAHDNIHRHAERIAGEQGIPYEDARRAVFEDGALLRACHDVLGLPVPGRPESTITAQNF